MTDRELLELAAKAAGFPHPAYMERGHSVGINRGPTEPLWNPLLNDGDALRLAVKLRISLTVHLQGYSIAVTAQSIGDSYTELCDGDEMAATRRAIVRAAAAIGAHKEGD